MAAVAMPWAMFRTILTDAPAPTDPADDRGRTSTRAGREQPRRLPLPRRTTPASLPRRARRSRTAARPRSAGRTGRRARRTQGVAPGRSWWRRRPGSRSVPRPRSVGPVSADTVRPEEHQHDGFRIGCRVGQARRTACPGRDQGLVLARGRFQTATRATEQVASDGVSLRPSPSTAVRIVVPSGASFGRGRDLTDVPARLRA
jgi:hypothetical protein